MSIRKAILSLALMAGLVPAISFAQAPPAVPGLPDTERRVSYSISSQTGPFSVTFALYGDSTDYGDWVQVYLCTSAVLNPCSQLTAVTQWTLSSASGSLATLPRPITDATITLVTAQTGTLQIVGARRPRRTSQFTENRGVAARDINQTVTDLVAQNREVWDRLSRTIQGQPGEVISILQPAATRKGGFPCWDSTGLILNTCAAGSAGTANVVGPNVSVVGHIATFGNIAGTVLLDGGLVGAGNVIGPNPSVSVANHAVTFLDAGGINVKDSGLTLTPSTGTITLVNGKTVTLDNTIEFAGADATKMTFPGASDTIAGLGTIETWTAAQTYTNSTLKILGSSTGVTSMTSANSGASNFTLTIPAATDTIAELGQANAFTGNNSLAGTTLITGSAFSLASNGQGTVAGSATGGLILGGQGSTSDLSLTNKSGTSVCSVLTGTTTFNCPGTFTFGVLDPTSLGSSITTITGLTVNNTPSTANDYIPYYSAADGRIRRATIGSIASAATSGVSALNGLTGSLSVAAGTGLAVSAGGSSVTVALGSTRPTTQSLTSASGTYTTAAGALWIEIYMPGGGGGGGGTGSAGGTSAGGNGGDTCWKTSGAACSTPDYKAAGGTGGAVGSTTTSANGGIGGAGGVSGGSGTTPAASSAGADGNWGSPGVAATFTGRGGKGGSTQCGALIVAGGDGATGITGGGGGGGGGGGACTYVVITNPAGTYTYVNGAAGTAGASGTGGAVGIAGTAAKILVVEHYSN